DTETTAFEPEFLSSLDGSTTSYEPQYLSAGNPAAPDGYGSTHDTTTYETEYHPAPSLVETAVFRPAALDHHELAHHEPEYQPEYHSTPEPVPAATATGPSSGSGSEPSLGDLLAPRRTRQQAVATEGVRAWIHRASFGKIAPRPGEKERRHLAAVETVRRPLDGPRTFVVINPKGGAHKTTTTLMLAATLGQQRGGYALAWDNNETHGTLGWRSTAKGSGGTALDLLGALPELQALGDLRVGDLGPYVRSQGSEQFDVLASDEDATSGTSVNADAFHDLHAMVSRFYRTIVVDTGNNIRASNWRAAVEVADRLVIVTTVREDSAQAAAWAVDALRAAGLADLVRSSVTILSAPDRKPDKDLRNRLRQHFGGLTRTVVEIPFDVALVSGGAIDLSRLRPATKEAWLQAAAAVVDGL
ncbi:MAG: chromosome partitioning protein, partial [Micrococcales bacterium]|nr:chromosome partitioning protein [Micrococcales bacterium]